MRLVLSLVRIYGSEVLSSCSGLMPNYASTLVRVKAMKYSVTPSTTLTVIFVNP